MNLQWQNFRHVDGKGLSGGDLGTEDAADIPQPMGAGCSRTHADLRELDGKHTNPVGQAEVSSPPPSHTQNERREWADLHQEPESSIQGDSRLKRPVPTHCPDPGLLASAARSPAQEAQLLHHLAQLPLCKCRAHTLPVADFIGSC